MGWYPVSIDGSTSDKLRKTEFLIDSESDISTPPANDAYVAPGSTAYTADLGNIYMKAADGTWTKVGE